MLRPSEDAESLRRSRRGRCLETCLVMSVTLLFVAVTLVTVGGAIMFRELGAKLEPTRCGCESHTSPQKTDNPNPSSRMQNFAYLGASSSELKTSTMQWIKVEYGSNSSVGDNFEFNPSQSSLAPKKAGIYFIYVDLNLTCTYDCNAGLLSIQVGDRLTCEVELPAKLDSSPVSKKCWTVCHMDKQRLLTQMTVPKGELRNWKLELVGSGLGIFLVD